MKVSIGKNTLGGGKKMTTRLNNYNRSTHDLSFVCRTSAAVGTLIPTMKTKVLPGDTFPIETRCHTLTHPTIGPLFGSFKQQNDFFFCPDRLYNAMLHNNALNVGLNMKSVKYPKIGIELSAADKTMSMRGSNGTLKNLINPSSLPAYLGLRNPEKQGDGSGDEQWNATPIIAYFDIFKNYYANKQEEKFYTISGESEIPFTENITEPEGFYIAPTTLQTPYWVLGETIRQNAGIVDLKIGSTTNAVGLGIFVNGTNIEEKTYIIQGFYKTLTGAKKAINGTIADLIEQRLIKSIPVSQEPGVITKGYVINDTLTPTAGAQVDIYGGLWVTNQKLSYASYNLTAIDNMRESILAAGKAQYLCENDEFIKDIFKLIPNGQEGQYKLACANPMVGLALKTYQSDINTNWVNTEWIDGESGINAITSIDTSSGSFTLDTLNLAKKVYTMLNRIAVSDGSYNAWIQTVYTSGGLNHIETPLYLGGSSLEIDFQEVVNNSGTDEQPLGTLAGRGLATNHKGGKIVFKADEPGYIFCITSITPRVDYFQGNDWDMYLDSLDDLHKPQLDGIGFQDRLYRSINANSDTMNLDKSIGKQPAWIEYMTNVNKTFGNFALVENEGWMCLNRIFGEINTYTTYVQPHLYNNIFADTDISAQNFWIQIAFNMKPRRVMSAKVIPNI
jgi:hypothetical protein